MKKLVILGAGANGDFGFPTGIELSKEIHSRWRSLSEKYKLFLSVTLSELKIKFESFSDPKQIVTNKIKLLSERFYYASAESIDDFLSTPLEEYQRLFGKLTMLDLILEKERDSIIEDHPKHIFKWDDNWLRIFFGQEFRFETIEKLDAKLTADPIRFITFNYDRSLEYFIFNAIKNYYGLEQQAAMAIFKKIEFFHVYGKLAPLEWESVNQNEILKYGENYRDITFNSAENLFRYASNIKVINEDRGNFDTIKSQCKTWIQDADKVHILGFGFLETNYKLLGIDEYRQSMQLSKLDDGKFSYTEFGLSVSKKSDIRKKLGINATRFGSGGSHAYNLTIYDYIRHHY